MALGKSPPDLDILNRRKNGELYRAFDTISHIRYDQGSVTHFICLEHDITEPKQAVETSRFSFVIPPYASQQLAHTLRVLHPHNPQLINS